METVTTTWDAVTVVPVVTVDSAAVVVPHTAGAVVVWLIVVPDPVMVVELVRGCTKREHASEMISHTKTSNCRGRPGMGQLDAEVL